MEKEISKAEFKAIYFQQATPQSGWTREYWDSFFEGKEGQRYFVYTSTDVGATQMFIRAEGNKHCIYFLTEESEESFFHFPGKE